MSVTDFPNINTRSPDGKKPGGKPYRLIIAEDKEFAKKQLVQILESEGYEIAATASNGREALDRYEMLDGKVDLITTALDMPILDGYAFLHELKKKRNIPPVIFISEMTTKGVMQDLISLGIADYIVKPIVRRQILDRIKKVLQKK